MNQNFRLLFAVTLYQSLYILLLYFIDVFLVLLCHCCQPKPLASACAECEICDTPLGQRDQGQQCISHVFSIQLNLRLGKKDWGPCLHLMQAESVAYFQLLMVAGVERAPNSQCQIRKC